MRRTMMTRAERAHNARELAKSLPDQELIDMLTLYSARTVDYIALHAEAKRRKLKPAQGD